MSPSEDHVKAAEQALSAIRTADDYDRWHDTYAHGEQYVELPDAYAARIEQLAQRGRERAMSHTFPLLAG
ncbi:hypothetical protein [Paradevosia shaoguanensis]|uniref:hypothetical protein n=1 Tax=Paradevosia shaoguanensis TaxID=1335043 RepID=UPI001933A132|nr:hypothetical protein [Paradevosia shaoguanensis]